MPNITIQTEAGHFYVTPVGFLVYAEDYLKASVNWVSDRNYSPVPYFLACRSIELALKSFLLIKGEKNNTIRNSKLIGHNLIKALDKAEQLSLADFVNIASDEREELHKANEYYREKKKRFEYFVIENVLRRDLPNLVVLQELASKILKNTRDFIVSSA